MTERLGRVARAFQTFEQRNLESLLFGFAMDQREQSLQLRAMSQIANPIVKAKHEFAILCEFFRIWIFVNAIDRGNRALLELACHGLVCGQHELFDQLMRFVVFNAF